MNAILVSGLRRHAPRRVGGSPPSSPARRGSGWASGCRALSWIPGWTPTTWWGRENAPGWPSRREWTTSGFSLEEDGVTYSSGVSSNAALPSLRSREQIESDQFLLEDLGLEPGDDLLVNLARGSRWAKLRFKRHWKDSV